MRSCRRVLAPPCAAPRRAPRSLAHGPGGHEKAVRTDYVPEFAGVRIGGFTAASSSKRGANQDRWHFTRSPVFGLWLAVYDGRSLGGQRVADRALQQLLPLCEQFVPPSDALPWDPERLLPSNFEGAHDLLSAMHSGFVAAEMMLSQRYVNTHTTGGVAAVAAAVIEAPPPPPDPPGSSSVPTRLLPTRRKLLLAQQGDSVALLRSRGRVLRLTPPPRAHRGESGPNGGKLICSAPFAELRPLGLEDDVIVLCSDGVAGALSDEMVVDAAGRAWPHAQEAAEEVVRAALGAGARDDCTAVVAFFGAPEPA